MNQQQPPTGPEERPPESGQPGGEPGDARWEERGYPQQGQPGGEYGPPYGEQPPYQPSHYPPAGYAGYGSPSGQPGYGPWQQAMPGMPGTPGAPAPRRRGFPLFAWIVILLAVGFILAMQLLMSADPSASTAHDKNSVDMVLARAQSQYLIGAAEITNAQRQQLYYEADDLLNFGTLEQRMCFVILARELAGAEEADWKLAELDALIDENDSELTATQAELSQILHEVYALSGHEAGENDAADADAAVTRPVVELSSDDRQTLEDELGWMGELAITHAMPGEAALRERLLAKAQLVAVGIIVFFVVLSLLGLAGFVGLILMCVLVGIGKVRLRLPRAIADGGIYTETFAVWLVLFFVLQIIGGELFSAKHVLLVSLMAFFLSLVAVGWPVLRGIPWREVRRDIGWHTGRGVLVEIGAGIGSYAMTLPLAAVGLLGTLILMAIVTALSGSGVEDLNPFAPSGYPAHPIIESAGSGGWLGKFMILLVAAVAAPIVEETFFRGVLYRSLRNSSMWWPRFASVGMSLFIVSLIFAVIHPQGLVAVPALGAIAAGMTLAREWRDSLIAPMVLHGINNGLLMLLLITIAS